MKMAKDIWLTKQFFLHDRAKKKKLQQIQISLLGSIWLLFSDKKDKNIEDKNVFDWKDIDKYKNKFISQRILKLISLLSKQII